MADNDKTLVVVGCLTHRSTTGVTVHCDLGRKLGRSVALLWRDSGRRRATRIRQCRFAIGSSLPRRAASRAQTFIMLRQRTRLFAGQPVHL